MFKNLNHVIVMVSDMDRSIDFYKNTLGLPVESSSENWSEFNLGATRLALHGGGRPHEGIDTDLPHSERAGTASISFDVEDVDQIFLSLKEKNVPFSLEPTLRQGESIKLAVAKDPDGFEICFAQRL